MPDVQARREGFGNSGAYTEPMVPAEAMPLEIDPSEARYQQLLKMYGIGQPAPVAPIAVAPSDPYTDAQRMLNGTEMAPMASQQAPAGMPDNLARNAGFSTGGAPAGPGVYGDGGPSKIKDRQAALDFYGGDQNKFDILSKLYGW